MDLELVLSILIECSVLTKAMWCPEGDIARGV